MSDSAEEKLAAKHFTDDLATDYANNVAYESTAWDLKLIFGEYSDQDKAVDWHTSMTIPWAQAKLMPYYLQINVEAYELEHGKIMIPPPMLPQEPPQPVDPDNRIQVAITDIVRRRRNEFVHALFPNHTPTRQE